MMNVKTNHTLCDHFVVCVMEAHQPKHVLGTPHPSMQISLCGTFKVSLTCRVRSRTCLNSTAISRAGTSPKLHTWQTCFRTQYPSTRICLDGMLRKFCIWMEYSKVLHLWTCAIEDPYVGLGVCIVRTTVRTLRIPNASVTSKTLRIKSTEIHAVSTLQVVRSLPRVFSLLFFTYS